MDIEKLQKSVSVIWPLMMKAVNQEGVHKLGEHIRESVTHLGHFHGVIPNFDQLPED